MKQLKKINLVAISNSELEKSSAVPYYGRKSIRVYCVLVSPIMKSYLDTLYVQFIMI